MFFEELAKLLPTILLSTILISIPLLITSLGGLFSEKSGVINIGLEGMMVFGAFGGAITLAQLQNGALPWFLVIIIALIVSVIFSLMLGALHAFLTVKIQINQIISGTAINMLAPAVSFFIMKEIYGRFETPRFDFKLSPFSISAGASITMDKILTVVLVLLFFIITVFLFKKTKFGRHMVAVGQNPQACATVGLEVNKMRTIAVLISSAFAGLGGISLVILIGSKLTLTLISGYGFLALAILIFSGWNAYKCFLGSLLFAFFIAVIPSLSGILGQFQISGGAIDAASLQGIIRLLLETGPYIIAIIILMIFARNNKAPNALGQGFDKEQR